MKKSKLFGAVPQNLQEKLLDGVKFKHFNNGVKVFEKNEKVGLLVIVLEGNVINGKKEKIAMKGEIVNEESLSDQNRGSNHAVDLMMEGDGVVAVIDYEAFRKSQGSAEKIQQGQQEKSQSSSTLINQLKQYSIKDLNYISKLGSGQFGSVYLCKLKGIEKLFALKYVTRAHVQQFGIQKHIQQEKAVLELIDHQFILKFYRSFKDDENIYFLTEFIPGMELFDAIRVIGLLGKQDSQFYGAQMVLQMEYLHSIHHIVYRDIKPENIMVDDTGYLKLVDMGTAKFLQTPNGQSQKTFTIIGTPHYMAPEVISGKGYNYMADLWSVGVCLYEFICGGLPFGEEAEDPFEIYKEIVKKAISYPAYMADKTAKSIIEQLMNKTPELRLGGSYTALKQHAWFKDMDWDGLNNRKLKAPILPGKDKILNAAQIKELEAKQVSVVEQIKKDTAGQKKVHATAKDHEWDHAF